MSKARQAIGILGQYGFISATGAEAGDFLQSQLSADILALEKGKAVLTAWHNPKGRVLSCLNVVARDDEYWLALPRAMTDDICAGLQRFIFRSKVRLQVVTEAAMAGRVQDGERQSWFGPATELQQQIEGFHAAGERELSDTEWELAEIRAGIPAVAPPCSGLFTGQMLNLDLIGGISFSKGCYPGQEIIARTHHLGRAKRRMHRYVSTGPA
ncbi:MAG: hypothetical protein KJO35_02730, partial [Gammaproteobacteria bacterium]|nr:hypothetical protein [Gammaproteobacteria bacterium]